MANDKKFVVKNGLTSGSTPVIDQDGNWIGPNSGLVGYTGSQGAQGVIGYTGSQGIQGVIGYTGSRGATGFTGSQGAQGVIGYTGSRGATGFTGSQGIQGIQGFTGSQGIQGVIGYTGSRGATGYTGSRGATGYTGSEGNNAGSVYLFSTTTTDADPGTGYIRFNNAAIASTTIIYIDLLDNGGVDITNFIDSWDDSTNTVKGYIAIDSNTSSDTSYGIFRLNSITTATGYRKLNVTYLSGTGPSNNEKVVLRFFRAGDRGYTGSQGNQGTTGFTGSQGIQGVIGYTGSQGIQGVIGYTGSRGATGFTGSAGSAAVGGLNTQIQYNSAGTLAGSANFTYDSATGTVSIVGADPEILLGTITNEPSAPASGKLTIYAKNIAGRSVLKLKGPSGLDYPVQAALWGKAISLWQPTTATAGLWLGTAGAGAGIYTTQLPTTTNIYTSMKRGRWANFAIGANQVLGQRNTEAMFFRGNSTVGGFFFFARGGFDVWTNGGRFFSGMHTNTTVVSANPSELANTIGFGVDSGDNGLIYFITRDAATSARTSTGLTIVSNNGYDMYMYCPPDGLSVSWRIVDINTGTEASGTQTANLPVATTMLTAGVLASNAALTAAASIQLGINRIYVETDY